MTIKAILFDMGNVLFFFDAKRSSQAFSKATGVSEEKIWEVFFISQMEKAYTRGELTTKEFYDQVCKHFPRSVDFDTFAHLWNDIFTENKEMTKLIKKLKKNYPLYLISNTNDLHYEYIRKKFDVLNDFTKCFPSHLVGHRKPDQAMFHHVIKEVGFKPEEMVFIDDVLEFVEAARKTGIHGVQYQTMPVLEKDLKKLDLKF
jgi:putative hydrolase of the HAD superfamily